MTEKAEIEEKLKVYILICMTGSHVNNQNVITSACV